MILKTLIIEGSPTYEKQKGLFPMQWKTHYLTEMFLAYLSIKTVDGSSKIVIETNASEQSINPTEKPYHQFKSFGVSTYNLNEEQVETLYTIEPYSLQETRSQAYKRKKKYEAENRNFLTAEQGQKYMLEIIENVLIDIAKRSNADNQIAKGINNTVQIIINEGFHYEKKVGNLSKSSSDRQYRAEVYRCLSRETGEAWRLHVTSKGGKQYSEWITAVPDYMDRTDFFKRSRWDNSVFRISDNLGNSTVTVNMNENPPTLNGMFLEKRILTSL